MPNITDEDLKTMLLKESKFIENVLSFLPSQYKSSQNDKEESLLYFTNEVKEGDTAESVQDEDDRELKKKYNPGLFGSATRAKNYQELRQRLHERLAEFQGKKDMTRIEQRRQQKLKKKLNVLDKKNKTKNKQSKGVQEDATPIPKAKPQPKIFNKDGNMVFSKFDFAEAPGSTKQKSKGNKQKYERILQKIQEEKEKKAELKEKGEDERLRNMEESKAWKKALEKSKGEKVLDDPELVKKTLKKHERKKKSSKKNWENRLEAIKNVNDAKQKKRKENIRSRKDDKLKKKMVKLKKKGRMIPGFS